MLDIGDDIVDADVNHQIRELKGLIDQYQKKIEILERERRSTLVTKVAVRAAILELVDELSDRTERDVDAPDPLTQAFKFLNLDPIGE